MDSSGGAGLVATAKVSQPAFLAVLWTFTALAFLFVVFRLAVRVVSQRRLFVDDLLVITAWVILLTTAVIWQIKSPILYHFYLASAGKVPFTPEFALEYIQFMRYIAPLTILFYSGLWAVKFSFMAFFFKLNSQIKNHRIWWWVVFVVTAGVYIASVADIDYRCSFGSASTIMTECPTLERVHYQNRTFYANCAGDVVTDLMILSIPVLILWRTRIALRRKLILFGVFSVIVVIVAVSIIRVAVNNSPDKSADISWLYFWSVIEMGTAIIVACMASFRQLFVTSQNKHLYGDLSDRTPRRNLLSYLWSTKRGTSHHSHAYRAQHPGRRRSSEGDGSQKSGKPILLRNDGYQHYDVEGVKMQPLDPVYQRQRMV